MCLEILLPQKMDILHGLVERCQQIRPEYDSWKTIYRSMISLSDKKRNITLKSFIKSMEKTSTLLFSRTQNKKLLRMWLQLQYDLFGQTDATFLAMWNTLGNLEVLRRREEKTIDVYMALDHEELVWPYDLRKQDENHFHLMRVRRDGSKLCLVYISYFLELGSSIACL